MTVNKVDYLCQYCSETNSFLRGQFNPSTRIFDGLCVEVDEYNHPIRLVQYSSGKQLRLMRLFSDSSVVEYDVNGRVIYEGTFLYDPKLWYPRDGYGDEYYEGKLVYSGCFTNGLRNGQGTAYYLDRHVLFNGNWKEGRVNGSGVCICRDGSLFANGEWNNGELVMDMELISFDEAVRNDDEMCQVFSTVLSYLFKEETVPRSGCTRIDPLEDIKIEEISPLMELKYDDENECDVIMLNRGLEKHISERRESIIVELRKRKVKLESYHIEVCAISDSESSSDEADGGLKVVQDLLSPEEVQRVFERSSYQKQDSEYSVNPSCDENVDNSTVPQIAKDISPPPFPDVQVPSTVQQSDKTHDISTAMKDSIKISSELMSPSGSSSTLPPKSLPADIHLSPFPQPSQPVLPPLRTDSHILPFPQPSQSLPTDSQVSPLPQSFKSSPLNESPTPPSRQSLPSDSGVTQPSLPSLPADSPVSPFPQLCQSLPSSLPSDSVAPQIQSPFPTVSSVSQFFNSSAFPNNSQPPQILSPSSLNCDTQLSQSFTSPIPDELHQCENPSQSLILDHSDVSPLFPQSPFSSNKSSESPSDSNSQSLLRSTSERQNSSTETVSLQQSCPSNDRVNLSNTEVTLVWDETCQLYFKGVQSSTGLQGKGQVLTPDHHILQDGIFANNALNGPGNEYFAYETTYDEYSLAGLPIPEEPVLHLTGSFIDGKLEGEGKEFGIDGNVVYSGSFHKGLYEGEGTLYDNANEVIISGIFKNGNINGKGKKVTFFEQLIEEGDYHDGKLNGKGRCYYPTGQIEYEGEFKDGNRCGYGQMFDNQGRLVYQGEWLNGIWKGEGIYYDYDHNVQMEGEFVENQLNGVGCIRSISDQQLLFQGVFQDSILTRGCEYSPTTHHVIREGTYTLNHTRFVGKLYRENGSLWIESIFDHDTPNGATKLYNENGDIEMEGGMKGGMFHGFCILYNPDGTKQIECEYQNGKEEGEKTEFDHGYIRWNGMMKNGSREGAGKEYDPNGRIQFKGEYRGNKAFEGTETKYMSVEKEQWCFCRTIHNGSYSSELLIYAVEDESPRELGQSWQCVYQGGWIQDSSSNVTYDGEWLFDGSDIPLKHGQGVLYLSDGRSVQTEWNRDLPDLEKSTVFTTEKPGTKLRRSRYVGGILLEIFESLLHPDLCYHGQGIFYYEDDSFFMGIWDKGRLQDYQPFIYWSDRTVKYETRITQMSTDGRFAHEFMPSKQTRYHPKNWNGYVEGMFSQEYNCIQNPVYYYDNLGHMICGPANAQYSMNPDGYNVEYGYPRL